MLRRIRSSWPWLVPTGWACVITTIPGIGALDYHASLALAPVIGLCCAHLTLRSLRDSALGAPTASPRWMPWLMATLAPCVVLLLGATIIANCNIAIGLVFYALGPLMSAWVGWAMATVAHAILPRHATKTFYALLLLGCVRPIWHFLHHPQVFAYHGLAGFIAGAPYEDAVTPGWAYISFRLLDLALWPAAIAWLQSRGSRRGRIALIVLSTAAVVTLIRAPIDGWQVSTHEVNAALPVRLELVVPRKDRTTPLPAAQRADASPVAPPVDLILHLPAGARWQHARRWLAQDAMVRYVELTRFFGYSPDRPIDVYLYPDAATKQRLMGARRVDMAKPWLNQVHMTIPPYAASVLKHELAHVFAARHGPWPFAVPTRFGLLPDPLLIEGVAVAAEWPIVGGLDPHHLSRAMRQLDLAPPTELLLSTSGFVGTSAARAYTIAGSFVRWMVERHGVACLHGWYRSGSTLACTARPLARLVEDWQRFVDGYGGSALDESALSRARARFERPGIFERPCALEIGRCRQAARRAFEVGRLDENERIWRRLLEALEAHVDGSPLAPDLTMRHASALSRIGRHAEAIVKIEPWLEAADSTLSGTGRVSLSTWQRGSLLTVAGDLHLQAGRRETALGYWQRAAKLAISNRGLRALRVRDVLSGSPAGAQLVRRYLAAGRDRPRTRWLLDELVQAAADQPLSLYLWSRAHLFDREHLSAVAGLDRLIDALPPDQDLIREECLRLLALTAAAKGDCRRSRAWLALLGSERRRRLARGDEIVRRCEIVRGWRAAGR